MAAGSLAAHALSYLFVSTRTAEGMSETSERTSTGGASYLVLFFGVFVAMAFVVLIARRRRGGELSPWLFFVLPPLAFVVLEIAERLLRAEVFPFHAALEPRFLAGLLLQLPFGLLALLVARALMRVVEQIVRALARAPRPRLGTPPRWSLRQAWDLPRIPALALGYQQRGPPTL